MTQLFCPRHMSKKVDLPSGFVIRPLQRTDYDKGYIQLLAQLTVSPDISKADYEKRFDLLKKDGNYIIIVIEDTQKKKVVATGTFFIEYKFIRNCSHCGHIEDVVTDKNYRGKHFGNIIVNELLYVGKQLGCYKQILDCTRENMPFYEKSGFTEKEVHMAYYYPAAPAAKL